jgi:hypothetical protein
MTQERIFGILLIALVSGAVMLAGCTSQSQEKASQTPTATVLAERTAVPVSTTSPPYEHVQDTTGNFSSQYESACGPGPAAGNCSFAVDGISFSYPDRFKQINNSSLEKMRAIAELGGINILTILTASDSKDSIQVTRQNADATIEGLYNEKMSISREVAVNGSANVLAMTFVMFNVERSNLPDGTNAVKVTAKNSEGGAAVTYLFCRPGVVYNINFVYDGSERAEKEVLVRDTIFSTLRLE